MADRHVNNAEAARSGNIPNRSMAPGIIIPVLAYADVATAAAWLCRTYRFRERLRIGNHRVQLVFNGTSVIVSQGPPRTQPVAVGHALMVRVEDVTGHHDHARECGATIISPPTDFPYGERQYSVEDPEGYRWTFSQSIADVDPGVWGGTLLEAPVDGD